MTKDGGDYAGEECGVMGSGGEKAPPEQTDDRELIRRYRRGDTGALEQLVIRYQRPLLGYLLNMTGDRQEADELFQEVWLRVVRKIRLYSHRNFGGWLLRIARNCLIDRIRREKPETSLDEEPEHGRSLYDILAGSNQGPASRVAAAELGQRIAGAVATLPPEQKEVFLLRVEGGLRFREIARIQRTSINTALARMQYALHKLREVLKEDYKNLEP